MVRGTTASPGRRTWGGCSAYGTVTGIRGRRSAGQSHPGGGHHRPRSGGRTRRRPGRFDALFGETLLHSVEQAHPPAEEKPARPTRVDRVTLVDLSRGHARSRPRVPGDSSFIDAAPVRAAPHPALLGRRQVQNGSARAGDHDGATVARGRRRVPSAPTSDGASDIRASLCPEQHPNPPQSASCRICGRSVGGAVVSIPQPSIGGSTPQRASRSTSPVRSSWAAIRVRRDSRAPGSLRGSPCPSPTSPARTSNCASTGGRSSPSI